VILAVSATGGTAGMSGEDFWTRLFLGQGGGRGFIFDLQRRVPPG